MRQTMGKSRLSGRVLALSLMAMALVAFGLSSSAQADVFTLTNANANLATQGAGPYGTIAVTGSGTSWHALGTGLNSFVFGDGGIIGLDIVAGAGAVTLNVASCSSTCSNGGSGNEDGFGNFSFTVNDGPGFSTPHSTFSFDFTTANSIATVAALLDSTLPNVAAHMALSTNTACTGFAANGGGTPGSVDNSACTTTSVPEPGSLLFFGPLMAFAGMVGVRRWKSR